MAGVLLATMTAAHAGWTTRDASGTPVDVRAWGSGVVSVSSNLGASLYQADGGVTSVSAPPSMLGGAGTYLTSTGCFTAFWRDNAASSPTTCAPMGAIVDYQDIPSIDLRRAYVTESGAGYALAKVSGGDSLLAFSSVSEGGFSQRPWNDGLIANQGTPMTFGALSYANAEHALLALGTIPSSANLYLYWVVDGATRATYGISDSISPAREVQAIDLFPGGGSTPTALFSWAGDLYRGPLVNGSQPSFVKVPLPTAPGLVTGVDVNTGAGSVYGDGFGMVAVQNDGGVTLLSAVPARQPQDIGLQWRPNSTFSAMGTAPRYVSCYGAKTCVLAQKLSTSGNLLIYTNAAPPTITGDGGVKLLEGTQGYTYAVRASDPDGDAVLVTVLDSPAPELTFSRTEVDGGVDLQLATGDVCQDTPADVTAVASDGLAAHDQFLTIPFEVIHTRKASAPVLASNRVVEAGEQPLAITAGTPTVRPCDIASYRWSAVSSNAPTLAGSVEGASTVSFPTPPVLCQADGVSYIYRVEAVDVGKLASAPKDFTVQVLPWGRPNSPFQTPTPEPVQLLAGDSATGHARLTPDTPHHACDTPNSGFPGVDTVWSVVGGASLPSGVRLRTQDNTLITSTSAVTPELLIETDACADATFQLSVRHYTRNGSHLEGPESKIDVRVDPGLLPLAGARLEVSPPSATPERVSGTAKVSNLNCIEERGNVAVRLRLKRADGSIVVQQDVPMPGSGERAWQLPLEPTCEGQSYQLEAELLGTPQVSAQSVSVPPAELQLAPPEPPQLMVSCGEAAHGTLEQRIRSGPCETVPLTWEQIGGPELTQSRFTGQRIDVTTKGTDFGELIGNEVVMRITADTGQVVPIEQHIPITAEPFVSVDRRVENAVGAATDLIGVSVELHNLTECGVGQVDHMEHLEGADYVAGSARFNDTPVEAREEDGVLKVEGLVLEANSTGLLTYVVRPRLLGKTRFEGESFVRGVPVSQPLQVPVNSGCGCEGGGSGFAALGLAGLAAALRRRRVR